MGDHRIRLDDDEVGLIVAALRARRAMARGNMLLRLDRLVERLAEGKPGNPRWRSESGAAAESGTRSADARSFDRARQQGPAFTLEARCTHSSQDGWCQRERGHTGPHRTAAAVYSAQRAYES
jgi:hypothetical protein